MEEVYDTLDSISHRIMRMMENETLKEDEGVPILGDVVKLKEKAKGLIDKEQERIEQMKLKYGG